MTSTHRCCLLPAVALLLLAVPACEEPGTTAASTGAITPPQASGPAAGATDLTPVGLQARSAPATGAASAPATAPPGSTPFRIDFNANLSAGGAAPAVTGTANGQPLAWGSGATPSHVVKQDPSGLWKYELKSDSDGLSVSFALGGDPADPTASAGGPAQAPVVGSPTAPTQARDRLLQLRAQAAARQTARPHGAPGSGFHFDLTLSGDVDPGGLAAQLAGALGQQLAAAAAAAPGASSSGAQPVGPSGPSGSSGPASSRSPSGSTAVGGAPPTLPLPPLASLAGASLSPQQRAALMQDFWRALAAQSSSAPSRPAAASPGAAVAGVNPRGARDNTQDTTEERQAIVDVAELYLWLGAERQLDEARELVTEACQHTPVGRAETVAPAGQALEVLDADVEVTDLDGRRATVSWELTALLPEPLNAGEPDIGGAGELDAEGKARRPSVNLSGELDLVRDDGTWYVSCSQ